MRKKSGILSGAAALFAANAAVKLMGMIYKIPLQRILTDAGMGYFSAAYNVYAWFYVLSTAGLPIAVSVCVARARAEKRYGLCGMIYRVSLSAFSFVGAVFSALMLLFCRRFASLASLDSAYLCIAAISPCVLFSCVSAAVRGYYQGHGIMWVTAVSQLAEAAGKLVFGLIFAKLASAAGYGICAVSACAVAGITCGSLLSAVLCVIIKCFYVRSPKLTGRRAPVLVPVMKIALPVALSASVMNLSALTDVFMFPSLLGSAGYAQIKAAEIYGSYTTVCTSLVNLPSAFITPVCASVLPALTASVAEGREELIRSLQRFLYCTVFLIGTPCAAGLFALCYPIPALIFTESSAAISAPMLAVLSPAVVLIAILSASDTVLQSSGKASKALIGMSAGALLRVVFAVLLFKTTGLDVLCMPVAACACYLCAAVFNLIFARRRGVNVAALALKPAICAVLCGVSAKAAYSALHVRVNDGISTVLAVAFGAIIYLLSIYASGFLRDAGIYKMLHIKKERKNDRIRKKREVRL